jgi:IMP dehydrogenase
MYEEVVASGSDCAVAVGLGTLELSRAIMLNQSGARVFVLDVASAANINVVDQYIDLKIKLKDSFVIVGNFATADTVHQFINECRQFNWNLQVDAVKIGIGPSGVCTTRVKTGVGIPQFSAIKNVVESFGSFSDHNRNPLIIADGGMKTAGDICKALGVGADLVMCGGLFSGTEETPGEVVDENGFMMSFESTEGPEKMYKKYRGSASSESYKKQGKVATHRTPEGESITVPYKGPVNNILQDIEGGLRSSLSYTGSGNLKEYKENVEFIIISTASYIEGTAYGKKD